jgi:hypothetical protein
MDWLSALPARVATLAAQPVTRASAGLALFVAGAEVDARLCTIDDDALVERRGDALRARVAVLPLGPSLLVCDRLDAADDREQVCWPDDSSYHLAGALPAGRVARWIDLGCGSAFAQLARPELAEQRVATDANPRAVAFARLGGELSGVALEVVEADLGAGIAGGAELVSCNAPIPGDGDARMWRATGADFVARLFARARDLVAPGAMVVVHAALDAIPDELPGERVIVRYTPDGEPPFGIIWWRPAAAPRLVRTYRALTADRPHLAYPDREAAIV